MLTRRRELHDLTNYPRSSLTRTLGILQEEFQFQLLQVHSNEFKSTNLEIE